MFKTKQARTGRQGTGNRQAGKYKTKQQQAGNREQGTGNRQAGKYKTKQQQGTGNREQAGREQLVAGAFCPGIPDPPHFLGNRIGHIGQIGQEVTHTCGSLFEGPVD